MKYIKYYIIVAVIAILAVVVLAFSYGKVPSTKEPSNNIVAVPATEEPYIIIEPD